MRLAAATTLATGLLPTFLHEIQTGPTLKDEANRGNRALIKPKIVILITDFKKLHNYQINPFFFLQSAFLVVKIFFPITFT